MRIAKFTVPPGAELAAAASLAKRRDSVGEDVRRVVAETMDDVRLRGDDAVIEYSLKFDHNEPYELTRAEIDELASLCPPELYAIMTEAAENIRAYQARLLPKTNIWEADIGVLGQIVTPIERVGIYTPGGTAAYPSSLLMAVVPAKTAGVKEIVLCTPPTANLNAAVIAAAKIAGVNRIFAVGGIAAIASMTYGAVGVPKVDKIVGPGNAYVAEAKRFAFGTVDIDMIAGPSEILVIADANANPRLAAADMLSQAEHDPMAAAILVTTDDALADAVTQELELQLETLPRRDIAESSLRDYGAICVCTDLDSAAALSNAVAPEHLEVMTTDTKRVVDKITNAGAIFVGSNSPEPLGDYFAGPSHILPTNGTAKFFSPVSVESFLKKSSFIGATSAGIAAVADKIAAFARAEGFEAHARAAELRKR
ncbi:MAG: histidinol dehydrogenase [Oscillospiraceae bacterium]|jgi:histidinol dehydrogenase|nr:histidinol dehydrogenase [Oscillospiraceae bacterium]